MNVGNFLSTGQFAIAVPQGVPATLQYNELGRLEKIYFGYEPEKWKNITDVIAHTVMTENVVPITISIKGGTTWVYGVFYTHNRFPSEGKLPYCCIDILLNEFVSNPSVFSFVAGAVRSLGTQFRGAAPSRQWLQLSGFNLLPGKLVPAVNPKDMLNAMFDNVYFPYRFPLLSHIIVYAGKEVKFYEIDMSQHVVFRIVKRIDQNGFILADVSLKGENNTLTINYSDVVKWNLHPNTCIVLDDAASTVKILDAYPTDNKKREKRSSTVACSVCGNLIDFSQGSIARCNDIHCLSRVYESTVQLLSVLKLPILTYEDYTKLVKDGLVTCLSDILLLPEYKDISIEATIQEVLRAVIPYSQIGNDDIIYKFAAACNNNLESVIYFFNHPDRIKQLNAMQNSIHTSEIVEWASDSINVQEFQAICESITFKGLGKKFNGPSIFRNKKIFLTGRFNHGNHEQVSAILRSYAADVITVFSYKDILPDENAQTHISDVCILVGDLMEDVDGQSIRVARKNHIPVFSESDFFKRYLIDEDLAENL